MLPKLHAGGRSPPPAAIIVTVPSSPDDPPTLCPKILRTPPLQALELSPPSDMTSRTPFAQSLYPPPTLGHGGPPMSPFEACLEDTDLPPPGVEHFLARRALWTSPTPNPPSSTEPNSSRRRLESLLAQPGALEDDDVWATGLDRVWRGLIGGAKLKHRLPLALVIKILQAGWVREGTWPKGSIVPDSDDALDAPVPELEADLSLLSPTTSDVTTPASVETGGATRIARSDVRQT